MKKVVVFGADHHNTLWMARTLGMVGYYVILVIGEKRSFVATSKFVNRTIFYDKIDEVVGALLNLNCGDKIPLFTTGDVFQEYIDRHYAVLKEKFFLPNCGECEGEIAKWMNKEMMMKAAETAGFIIPKSWCYDLRKINVDFDQIAYPCIVKPMMSYAADKSHFRVCKTKSELCREVKSLINICTKIVVQEYIKADEEICILGMKRQGVVVIPGLIRKLRTCKSVFNLGMTAYAHLYRTIDGDEILKLVKRFLEIIDYDGLFSVELLKKNDAFYFLEINLRSDANLYVYTTAGVNLPQLWVEGKGNTELQKDVYGMVGISYLKYFPWSRPWEFFRDLWRADCFSIWDKRDIKPAFYKVWYKLLEQL